MFSTQIDPFFGGGRLFNIELLANWPFFAGKWWCGVHLPWGQINSLWWPLSLTPSYQRFSHQIKSRIKRQFNHQMGLPDFTTTLIFSHQSICMNWGDVWQKRWNFQTSLKLEEQINWFMNNPEVQLMLSFAQLWRPRWIFDKYQNLWFSGGALCLLARVGWFVVAAGDVLVPGGQCWWCSAD